ncbi:MAG: N-acetyl-gamma-glutamyl-phosphate reductase [Thermoanaerobaculia bacterium]
MKTPVVVLGASGYVGGELLRLLAGHPGFEIAAAVSASQADRPIGDNFPHLAGAFGKTAFVDAGEWRDRLAGAKRWALVSAAPHGSSAASITEAMAAATTPGEEVLVVDTSADFRYADPGEYAEVYGHPHPAPSLSGLFVSAVPEHWKEAAPRLVAHPGCFTTAALLAIVPLLARGIAHPAFAITAITGSTGSGRAPSEKTHHPARRSNVAAYQPLRHRHAPEMRGLAFAATGVLPEIEFVPISGPHARGIYLSLHGRLGASRGASEIASQLADYYGDSPFVSVGVEPPALTDVVGTNRARLGVAVSGDALSVTVAIDNLVKGAAGGALQWLNRMGGYDESAGLTTPGLGWF